MTGVLATAIVAGSVAGASGLWLDVPYIHQEKDGCGSAALGMVLRYWQEKGTTIPADRAEPEKIQRELYEPKLHGITASRMEQYLRDSGLKTFAFRGEWSDLRTNIGKGRPLIASLKPRSGPAHYVVITGIAPDNEAVLLNDPERGKLIHMERDQFEKAWKSTENWTLLAVPR